MSNTNTVLVLGGLALAAWWIAHQQQPVAPNVVTVTWPRVPVQPFAMVDGVQAPANGVPFVSQTGWVTPGGGGQTFAGYPLSPNTWALGGSPSGWNSGGSVGFDTQFALTNY